MSPLNDGLVFAGTRAIATRCLMFIIETSGRDAVSAILGAPRKKKTCWPNETNRELWEIADQYGIPFLDSMNDIARRGGFLVSVIWRWIFPANILAQFDQGGINLHPAPLPEYRGSRGPTHAILNGDDSFGVTVHYLSEQLDGGDIVGELRFPILESETASSLDARTQNYGYALFCESWLRLLDGSGTRQSQAELTAERNREAHLYTTRMTEELLMSKEVQRSAKELQRLYRALYLPPLVMPPEWLVDRVQPKGHRP